MNIHPFTVLTAILTLTTSLDAGPLEDAEQHLQAREYAPAAAKLSTVKDNDRAAYLHATALFLDKKFPAAEEAAAGLLKKHPDSKWTTKARFLLARALIEQQKHQAAEAIYAAEAERVFSTERKQGLAKRLIAFADKLSAESDPGDLDALPADHAKALQLYQQVLAMEITRELRDEILFKTGLAQGKISQHAQGIATFRSCQGFRRGPPECRRPARPRRQGAPRRQTVHRGNPSATDLLLRFLGNHRAESRVAPEVPRRPSGP